MDGLAESLRQRKTGEFLFAFAQDVLRMRMMAMLVASIEKSLCARWREWISSLSPYKQVLIVPLSRGENGSG